MATIIKLSGGPPGAPGTAATVSVGTVTTGAAGSSAAVTNAGTSAAAVFNFTIPRGATGATGETGATGSTGATGAAGAAGADREVKSSSFTAANGSSYSVVASATVTDPSPVEGKGYNVLVRNGDVVIGGSTFSLHGTVVERVFHSGGWANYPYLNAETGASTGGNGVGDAGRLVKFQSSGQISVTAILGVTAITGSGTTSSSGVTGSNSSTGPGVVATGTDGYGVYATSKNGVPLFGEAENGSYHARFGESGNDKSAIERVRGWFVWFFSTFVGRLKTADITANRDWTLPNLSGSVAVCPTYADDSAASAGGLSIGDLYYTGTKFRVRTT